MIGITEITLRDAITGKIVHSQKDENIVLNWPADVLSDFAKLYFLDPDNSPKINKFNLMNLFGVNISSSYMGSLRLSDTEQTIALDEDVFRGNIVGYGDDNTTASGLFRGLKVAAECGPITNGYKWTWEFPADVANGTIKSLGLNTPVSYISSNYMFWPTQYLSDEILNFPLKISDNKYKLGLNTLEVGYKNLVFPEPAASDMYLHSKYTDIDHIFVFKNYETYMGQSYYRNMIIYDMSGNQVGNIDLFAIGVYVKYFDTYVSSGVVVIDDRIFYKGLLDGVSGLHYFDLISATGGTLFAGAGYGNVGVASHKYKYISFYSYIYDFNGNIVSNFEQVYPDPVIGGVSQYHRKIQPNNKPLTLNNVTPVTKTSANTMTVTYTITES